MSAYGNAFTPAACFNASNGTYCADAIPAGTFVSCPSHGSPGTDDGLPATSACLNSPVAVYVDHASGFVIVADVYRRVRVFNRSEASAPMVTVPTNPEAPRIVTDLSDLHVPSGPPGSPSPLFAVVAAVGTFVAWIRVEQGEAPSGMAYPGLFLRTDNDCSESSLAAPAGLPASALCMKPVAVAFAPQGSSLGRYSGGSTLIVSDVDHGALWEVQVANQTARRVAGNVFSAACVPQGPTGGLTVEQVGDGGPATAACLLAPLAIAVAANGDIFFSDSQASLAGATSTGGLEARFFADFSGSRIRRVSAPTGIVSTLVGARGGVVCGNAASSGDGGPANDACILGPAQIALDVGDVGLFVNDVYAGLLWRVSIGQALPMIRIVAGVSTAAYPCWQRAASFAAPAMGAWTSALLTPLCLPGAVAVTPDGVVYIIEGASRALRVLVTTDPSRENGYRTAVLSIIDGATPQATLAFSPPNTLFVSQSALSTVSKIALNESFSAGPAVTVLGRPGVYDDSTSGDGGPATDAGLAFPIGVATDVFGNLFVADIAAGRVRGVVLGDHIACPVGSSCECVTPTKCAGNASTICPVDTVYPQVVSLGYYSVSDDDRGRHAQRACPMGSYCRDGLAVPCPPGSYGVAPLQVSEVLSCSH
jgi:hypothetical protein